MIKRDVLSFVDVVRSEEQSFGAGANSRQIAVNGALLDTQWTSSDVHAEFSSPLIDGFVRQDDASSFLRGFLTGESQERLPPGRFELGYCSECLGNDGWVVAAHLELTETVARWLSVGFYVENGFAINKSGPWWRRRRVEPPADWDWWARDPSEPDLSFTFDRVQYERVVVEELERVRAAS